MHHFKQGATDELKQEEEFDTDMLEGAIRTAMQSPGIDGGTAGEGLKKFMLANPESKPLRTQPAFRKFCDNLLDASEASVQSSEKDMAIHEIAQALVSGVSQIISPQWVRIVKLCGQYFVRCGDMPEIIAEVFPDTDKAHTFLSLRATYIVKAFGSMTGVDMPWQPKEPERSIGLSNIMKCFSSIVSFSQLGKLDAKLMGNEIHLKVWAELLGRLHAGETDLWKTTGEICDLFKLDPPKPKPPPTPPSPPAGEAQASAADGALGSDSQEGSSDGGSPAKPAKVLGPVWRLDELYRFYNCLALSSGDVEVEPGEVKEWDRDVPATFVPLELLSAPFLKSLCLWLALELHSASYHGGTVAFKMWQTDVTNPATSITPTDEGMVAKSRLYFTGPVTLERPLLSHKIAIIKAVPVLSWSRRGEPGVECLAFPLYINGTAQTRLLQNEPCFNLPWLVKVVQDGAKATMITELDSRELTVPKCVLRMLELEIYNVGEELAEMVTTETMIPAKIKISVPFLRPKEEFCGMQDIELTRAALQDEKIKKKNASGAVIVIPPDVLEMLGPKGAKIALEESICTDSNGKTGSRIFFLAFWFSSPK